ncbi:MAG: hypothetical protein PHY47_00635 [Lachnospiraceae bacterium]|nr:hypothetical protein [Lachnospiraceae bacterium]
MGNRKNSETFKNYVQTCLDQKYPDHLPSSYNRQINTIMAEALTKSYDLLLDNKDDYEKAMDDMSVILNSSGSIFLQMNEALQKRKQNGGLMKTLTTTMMIMCFFLIGCSSSPFKEQMEKQAIIMEHMKQGKQYIGGAFDQKFNQSGSDGTNLRAIGTSTYPVTSNENLARSAAIADAKFRLIDSAPTEFKALVQRAIGNSLGYQGEFNQIETSVIEVKGLRGIEVNENDVACKVASEPTTEGGYNTVRECKAIARVPMHQLNKAFDFTMEHKYGIQEKSSVEKILEEQLKQDVLDNKRSVAQEQ